MFFVMTDVPGLVRWTWFQEETTNQAGGFGVTVTLRRQELLRRLLFRGGLDLYPQ